VLRLLAKRLFEVKGICPPEYIGQKADCVDFILSGLKERGIVYHEVIETI